jgi:hypothetical protein
MRKNRNGHLVKTNPIKANPETEDRIQKTEYSKNGASRVSTVEVISSECKIDDYGKIFTR